MTLKYEIIIWWSDEDDLFIAELPQLEGCTAHGPTRADALREIQVAMRLWLDTVEEFGMEVPEPRCERLKFSYIWHHGEKEPELRTPREYDAIIYWSEKAGAYFAEVLDIPGCAADGRSYDEALAKAQAIADSRIESAEKDGREIPEPRTRLHFA